MKVLIAGLFVAALAPWMVTSAVAQAPAPAKKREAPADAKDKREPSGKKVNPAAPVDVNTASQAELESVRGIGAATAKKIIAGRPYSSVSDLSRAGISAKAMQEIGPMLKVSAAPPRPMPAPSPRPVPAPQASYPGQAQNSASREVPTGPAQQPPSPGMVWVNENTKVFHRQGDQWYGRTKKGKFMTEQDAIKAGYQASKQK